MDFRELNDSLMVEIAHQRINGVKDFLARGADINYYNHVGETPLTKAVRQSNLEIVKFLLSQGADTNKGKEKAINLACSCPGNLEIVKLLIEKGADVNNKSFIFEKTPLMCAVWGPEKANLELIRYLIEHGANPNLKDKDGKTALELAVISKKDVKILQYLQEETGKQVLSKEKIQNISLDALNQSLIKAVEKANIKEIEELVQKGANVNYVFEENYDFDGEFCTRESSILEKITNKIFGHYTEKDFATVKLLLDKGANPNQRQILVKICALGGKQEGSFKMAKLLIEHGADINITDRFNNTPILAAAEASRGDYDLVQYLLNKGADVRAKDKMGATILHYLCLHCYDCAKFSSIIDKVISLGANINEKIINSNGDFLSGDTPLTYVIRNEQSTEFMQLLIDKGADINVNIGNALNSPLGSALYRETRNNEEKAKILIQRGAKIEGETGKQALISAANGGYLEIVKILVEKGVDVNSADGYQSALGYAKSRGHGLIIEYLEQRGAKEYIEPAK